MDLESVLNILTMIVEKGSSIFLIDICGTIFRSNTTFDFISFCFYNKSWYQKLARIRKYRIVGVINAQIFKWFHIDIIRWYVISKLRGYTKKQLSEMASEFYEKILSKLINANVVSIIENKRQEGLKLVVVSATLDCISKEVCKRLNIPEQYSSELEYYDDICTGRLSNDLLANKLQNIVNNGLAPTYAGVITDNYSDVDIICKSQYVYLIRYIGKRNRWSSVINLNETNYEFIDIKI